ncbi:MAG: hypothetical protein RIQ79_750 [Verrucomicrobiota bacterium]
MGAGRGGLSFRRRAEADEAARLQHEVERGDAVGGDGVDTVVELLDLDAGLGELFEAVKEGAGIGEGFAAEGGGNQGDRRGEGVEAAAVLTPHELAAGHDDLGGGAAVGVGRGHGGAG